MDTYTSDVCPEAGFRHSKGMSDFQSSFFAKLKAPLIGVGTIAFVFSPAVMLARRVNRMMAENKDHGIVEDSAAGFAAEEYNDGDHHIITTTSNNLSAELVSNFSDPSSSSFYSTVAATFACVFAFVAWSARSYFLRTSGKNVAMPTAPQLFDMFLDLVLRPAVGVAGIITVMRTITRLATAQGILATATLPAVTMAHILCATAWALATWSALIYMFIGAKKDNETQRIANKASAPPVVYNIVEGEEVDLDVTSTTIPTTTTSTVDTTSLSGDVAAASAAAVHLDGLSSDDEEDIEAEEEYEHEHENEHDEEGDDEEEDITSDEDDEVDEDDEDDEDDEGDEGAAQDVDAAVLAKIVRRRERGIRIGAAISKILNGTSAGVLGRRHPLRQPRRGGDGDGNGADAENEATPTTTATATTKKASKFRRVMSDILNISNAASTSYIAHFTSSADEDEDDCDGDGNDSAFGASSSSAGGDVEAKAVGRFSKMLNACREASASGLSAAKRRYSRRSVS